MADAVPSVIRARAHRHLLTRRWAEGPLVLWCLLNPSTATDDVEDPTTRRVRAFSARHGFGGYVLVNLHSERATDPHELDHVPDYGVDVVADVVIGEQARLADRVVVGWGAQGARWPERVRRVQALLSQSGIVDGFPRPLWSLGSTKDGSPRHPLYVRGDRELEPWALLP